MKLIDPGFISNAGITIVYSPLSWINVGMCRPPGLFILYFTFNQVLTVSIFFLLLHAIDVGVRKFTNV